MIAGESKRKTQTEKRTRPRVQKKVGQTITHEKRSNRCAESQRAIDDDEFKGIQTPRAFCGSGRVGRGGADKIGGGSEVEGGKECRRVGREGVCGWRREGGRGARGEQKRQQHSMSNQLNSFVLVTQKPGTPS